MIKKLSIFTLTLALLTGCQPQQMSPTETLQAITKKMSEQNDIHQIMEGVMNADIEGEDSEQAQALGMFENLKYDLTTSAVNVQSDDITVAAEGTFDANGIATKYNMFANAEEVIVDIPMIGKLIVVPFADLFELVKEQSGEDIDPNIVKDALKDYREIVMPLIIENSINVFKDEDIELIDEHTFTFKDEEIKSKALKINLSKERYVELTEGLNEALKNSKEIFEAGKKYNIPNYPATFEDYQAEFDKIDEKTSNAALKSLDNMSSDFIFGYDDNYLVNFYKMNMNITIPETEEYSSTGTIAYDITAKVDYDNVTVTRPETTEENSIGLQELVMMLMMGSMN